MIPLLKKAGYLASVFFLELPNVDLAVRRVADRVKQGGHDIPDKVIQRRFIAGKENFLHVYKVLADSWRDYNNEAEEPVLISSSEEL
jgi:predicted ABC-type ATPase